MGPEAGSPLHAATGNDKTNANSTSVPCIVALRCCIRADYRVHTIAARQSMVAVRQPEAHWCQWVKEELRAAARSAISGSLPSSSPSAAIAFQQLDEANGSPIETLLELFPLEAKEN